MKVIPIRTFKNGLSEYLQIFLDISKITHKKESEITYKDSLKFNDYTEGLTYDRQKYVDYGYGKEVEQADKKFINSGRGFNSKESFEKFWSEYALNENLIEKYKNAL